MDLSVSRGTSKEKGQQVRFCVSVNYRKLNSVTHKDAYPLPRVDDSLDALGGSKWFSTLDMTSGRFLWMRKQRTDQHLSQGVDNGNGRSCLSD